MSLAQNPAPTIWTLGDRLTKSLKATADRPKIAHASMARLLDVDRNTIGNYCNDHTAPNDATLRVWAAATGWSYEWLKNGEGEGYQPDPGGGGFADLPNVTILCFSRGEPSLPGDIDAEDTPLAA